MKLVKTLCILCVGTSLSYASDNEVRPGTPYPGDYVSSTSVQHENQAPFPVVNQSLQSEESTTEAGRHTPEVSTTIPGDAIESDNKSVAVSGSGEDSPLVMYDPQFDDCIHSDMMSENNTRGAHILSKGVSIITFFAVHGITVVACYYCLFIYMMFF